MMPSSGEDIELCSVDRSNRTVRRHKIELVRFGISLNFDSFTISRMKLLKSHYNRKNKIKFKIKIKLKSNLSLKIANQC